MNTATYYFKDDTEITVEFPNTVNPVDFFNQVIDEGICRDEKQLKTNPIVKVETSYTF